MRTTAVIGANYGDEGKGLITDYLSSLQDNTVVVRFNGSSQAGHTVVSPDGFRHVFKHFGSGTLSGAETYLAKHFVLNPVMFYQEAAIFQKNKIGWRVATDPRCFVATPYDMIINQAVEEHRGKDRHGSVGVGFGETIERNKYPAFQLKAADLDDMYLVEQKLKNIRDHWLPHRFNDLGIPPLRGDVRLDNRMLRRVADAFDLFHKSTEIAGLEFVQGKNIVFEGAQGLALDMDSADFPHVTRSNTGLTNVIPIVKALKRPLDVVYVTRSYLTRHGAGPLPGEENYGGPKHYDETNQPHDYQGALRYAPFDCNRMALRIGLDMGRAMHPMKVSLAMTWCDHHEPDVSAFTHVPLKYKAFGPARGDVQCQLMSG